MIFRYIWQTYFTGITKKELSNVEIQGQTVSLSNTKKNKKYKPQYIMYTTQVGGR